MKEPIIKMEDQTSDFDLGSVDVLFNMEVITSESYETKKLENIPTFNFSSAHLQAKLEGRKAFTGSAKECIERAGRQEHLAEKFGIICTEEMSVQLMSSIKKNMLDDDSGDIGKR